MQYNQVDTVSLTHSSKINGKQVCMRLVHSASTLYDFLKNFSILYFIIFHFLSYCCLTAPLCFCHRFVFATLVGLFVCLLPFYIYISPFCVRALGRTTSVAMQVVAVAVRSYLLFYSFTRNLIRRHVCSIDHNAIRFVSQYKNNCTEIRSEK